MSDELAATVGENRAWAVLVALGLEDGARAFKVAREIGIEGLLIAARAIEIRDVVTPGPEQLIHIDAGGLALDRDPVDATEHELTLRLDDNGLAREPGDPVLFA